MTTRISHTDPLFSQTLRLTFVTGALAMASLFTGCGKSSCVTGPECGLDEELTEADEVDAQVAAPVNVQEVIAQVQQVRSGGTSSLICPPGTPGCNPIGGGGDENIYDPAIIFANDIYVVVYGQVNGGVAETIAVRLDREGNVLDESGIVLSHIELRGEAPATHTAIAFDGTNFLAAWNDGRNGSVDVYGNRISREGIALDGGGLALATGAGDQKDPSLAFDGANYLLAFTAPVGESTDVQARRLRTDGTSLDARPVSIASGLPNQGSASVAFAGSDYLVAFEQQTRDGSDIYGAQVSRDAIVRASFAIATASGAQLSPAVASGGDRFLVAWEDHRGANADIYGRVIGTNNSMGDESRISGADLDQGMPAVVFNGAGFTAAWTSDLAESPAELRGAKLDTSGAVLEGELLIGGDVVSGTGPALASDGRGSALAVWAAADGKEGGLYENFVK